MRDIISQTKLAAIYLFVLSPTVCAATMSNVQLDERKILKCNFQNGVRFLVGGVAQWLGRRISGQGVPGSNPGRCTFVVALRKSHSPLLCTG